jgi:thiol-disulfide isomerase/thioredoxin
VKKYLKINLLIITSLMCSLDMASADSNTSQSAMKRFFPSSYASSIFEQQVEKAIEVKDEEQKPKEEVIEVKETTQSEEPESKIDFATSDISKKKFLPPNETPSVAVNPEAPSSVISMIESSRRGDSVTAKAYAKQFVRMLQNYFFEVRQITGLIGDALIEESVIEDEDWIGAEQSIDIELAKTRLEKGEAIKPTHDVAMKRIIADPKKEVEVYFFFSRSCSYCRFMAPDVERLSRAFAGDKRVKFTGLVVGESYEDWLVEFRDYTGLNIEVFDGTGFAKHLKIGFLPVLLVVTPNGGKSYFKSGQQSFERMYEFVRTSQGLPVEDSIKLQSLIKTPIGTGDQLILASKSKNNSVVTEHFGQDAKGYNVNLPKQVRDKVQVDKF